MHLLFLEMVDVEVVNSVFEAHLSLVIRPHTVPGLGGLRRVVVKVHRNSRQKFWLRLEVICKLWQLFEFYGVKLSLTDHQVKDVVVFH